MLKWMIGLAVLLLVLDMFCCARAATLADGQMKQIMQGRKRGRARIMSNMEFWR